MEFVTHPFNKKICYSCSCYTPMTENCSIYGKEIPESVESSGTCPKYQIFQPFPSSSSLSSSFPISVTEDGGLSIEGTKNFVNYLGNSFKDDPVITETVNELADSIDNLEKSLSLSMDEIKEVKERFDKIEETIGEEKITEVVRTFFSEIEKPSIMDWKTITDWLAIFRKDISVQREKVETLTAKQTLSIERIEKLENKVNIASNTYWLISIIGSIVLGSFITVIGLIISGIIKI